MTNQTSVSGYTVTTGNDQNTFVPPTETSFVVNNLTAGIEYNFSVVAHNAFVVGEPAVINITVPTQAPPTGTLIYKPLHNRFHKGCIAPFWSLKKCVYRPKRFSVLYYSKGRMLVEFLSSQNNESFLSCSYTVL